MIELGAALAAARDRAQVRYLDRRRSERTGELVYWPTGRPGTDKRVRVRTPGGHYVNVRPADVLALVP